MHVAVPAVIWLLRPTASIPSTSA